MARNVKQQEKSFPIRIAKTCASWLFCLGRMLPNILYNYMTNDLLPMFLLPRTNISRPKKSLAGRINYMMDT